MCLRKRTNRNYTRSVCTHESLKLERKFNVGATDLVAGIKGIDQHKNEN